MFFVNNGIWLSAYILSAHNLSVFFSSALVLACAATGAAETVTGIHSFLLPAVQLDLLASVCVCRLAVHCSLFICAYLHEWLVMLVYFLFREGEEERDVHSQRQSTLFLFLILKSTFHYILCGRFHIFIQATWLPLKFAGCSGTESYSQNLSSSSRQQ